MNATAAQPFTTPLPEILESDLFSDIDREFARFIARTIPATPHPVLVAAALVSRARSEGNTCLDLQWTRPTSEPERSLTPTCSSR